MQVMRLTTYDSVLDVARGGNDDNPASVVFGDCGIARFEWTDDNGHKKRIDVTFARDNEPGNIEVRSIKGGLALHPRSSNSVCVEVVDHG